MKKFFKILLGLFLFGLSIALLIPIGFAIYLETAIDRVTDKEEMKEFIELINSSPELPESFYETYLKYYPETFENSWWKAGIKEIILKKSQTCQCRNVGYSFRPRNWTRFEAPVITLEVEEHCSQKKCFEYKMAHIGFSYEIIGIRQACRIFYNKELEELNEREIISFGIIPKATTMYSPLRNPEKLNAAIDKILQKY